MTMFIDQEGKTFRMNPGQLVKNTLIIQCNLWLEDLD